MAYRRQEFNGARAIIDCPALRSTMRFVRVSSWHSILLTGQRAAGFRARRCSVGSKTIFYWERPGLAREEVRRAVLALLQNPFWMLITGFRPMADFYDVGFMGQPHSQGALPLIVDFLGAMARSCP